ncbi:MAG TPA: GNAT family N-acetyltransferase [Myxococcales bacterium]|nr:GNAT family N-acetyltransferase [Myxococcales bacterium]
MRRTDVLEVRRAGAGDARTAASLLTAQLADHALPIEPAGIDRAVGLCFAAGSPATLLLAFAQGEPVGICLANWLVSAERGGRNLWVEELYVAPHARRRGVARALMAELRRLNPDARGIELYVTEGHDPARALYRSLGFRENRRTPFVLELECR